MRAVTFDVSPDLLGEVLHMPPTAFIVGAQIAPDGRSIRLTVEDANFPNTNDVPNVTPTIIRESIRWDWNLPS